MPLSGTVEPLSLIDMMSLAVGTGRTYRARHPQGRLQQLRMSKLSLAPPPAAKSTDDAPPDTQADKPSDTTPAELTPPAANAEAEKPENSVAFTTEQDAELLKLKQENRTWKQICAALDKPMDQVKKRWGEIRPKDGAQPAKEDTAKSKAEFKQRKAEEHKAKAAEAQKAAAAVVNDPFEDAGFVTLEEDENFTHSDLVLISQLLHRDREDMWTRVTSKFYDRTGRRVHPMDIKEKITGETA